MAHVHTDQEQPLAGHVQDSVDTIAAFHKDHYRNSSRLQRAMDSLTDGLGRPVVLAAIFIVICAWVTAALSMTGGGADQPAFTWLQLTASVGGLLVALLILVTQRRQDRLADRSAQLTLQLALLADRKSAKIIALLEELRRDHPDLQDRDDLESEEMARPANPGAVLEAIDDRVALKPTDGIPD